MPKVSTEYIDTRRQQIIDAAFRCFARKGFHQATMRDIYQEAGLSAGAVYHYFASKDEIIEASFAQDYLRSLPAFERAAAEADPLEAIEHLTAFFYAGLEDAAALDALRVNVQGWGEALTNPRLLEPLQQFIHDFRVLLNSLLRRAKEQGKIRSAVDPEAAAGVILSCFIGLYLQKAVDPTLAVGPYQEAVLALIHGKFAKQP